jgi:predicted dehydrogenase
MPSFRKKVRVGVVGVGIGSLHIQGYQQHPQAEVVAVCDINEARAQQVAQEYGVPHVFTDYAQMLEKVELNAVSVCTPNALHAPVAIAAMEAGCHILCEKPMAHNLQDAERMLQVARKTGVLFMMGMNNRFRGDSQLLKRYIERGDLGDIYYAKCGWLRRNGIPGFGGWFTTKASSGGGPLIDIGVHVLDLTWWLMGCPKPVAVYGATFAKFGPEGRGQGGWGMPQKGGTFDVEDLATAIIRFENGAVCQMDASWASYIERDVFYSQLMGTKGGATLEPLRIFTDRHDAPVDLAPRAPTISGHLAEVQHFVDCILKRKTPIAPIEQGVDIMRILDGIYRSAQTGEMVKV